MGVSGGLSFGTNTRATSRRGFKTGFSSGVKGGSLINTYCLSVTGNSLGNKTPRRAAAPISRTWISKPQVNAILRRFRTSVEASSVLKIAKD
jgi:hypothetical protein